MSSNIPVRMLKSGWQTILLLVSESGVNYETVYQAFQHISPDLKSAEYEVERARYDYKIAKGRLLPSLSLGGGISTNYYKNLSQKGQYDGFASQFHNNQGEYVFTLSHPFKPVA